MRSSVICQRLQLRTCPSRFAGAWRSSAVASRHHDNRHQHHHQLSTSTSTNRLVHCQRDDDCRQPNDALNGGETCHWLYEGCSVGICMCNPLTQKRHKHTGKCITGKYLRLKVCSRQVAMTSRLKIVPTLTL